MFSTLLKLVWKHNLDYHATLPNGKQGEHWAFDSLCHLCHLWAIGSTMGFYWPFFFLPLLVCFSSLTLTDLRTQYEGIYSNEPVVGSEALFEHRSGQAMAAFDLLLGSAAGFLPETLLVYINLYSLKKQICRAVELLMIHYHASR